MTESGKISKEAGHTDAASSGASRATTIVLWVIQVLLALLFLFAGVAKLVMPYEQMKGPVNLPEWFLRFIGVVEVLGGLGVVLPGLFKVRPMLTPLAAVGLVIIMIGATVLTIAGGQAPGAVVPAVTGILAAVVAYARWKVAPHADR